MIHDQSDAPWDARSDGWDGGSDGSDTVEPRVIWSAHHEAGDFNEWLPGGGFSGRDGSFTVIDTRACASSRSVELTIGPRTGSWTQALLFRSADLPQAGYYSAWYFIPSSSEPQDWYDIFLFQAVDGPTYLPMYVLGVDAQSVGERSLVLRFWLSGEPPHVQYEQQIAVQRVLPRDLWFHLEAYYDQDTGEGGHVMVWQNGEKIFDVLGQATMLSGYDLVWNIGYYTEAMLDPEIATMYVDDAVIAVDDRIGP